MCLQFNNSKKLMQSSLFILAFAHDCLIVYCMDCFSFTFRKAEELREGLCFFCKRRKRSLKQKKINSEDKSGSAIRISKEKANSMLTVRSKRASNLCLR